jgi:twitching motility protein PilT
MAKTVGDLLKQIEEFHLMPAKDFAAMRARWLRPGRKEMDDVDSFCKWLRVNHYVTDFGLCAFTDGNAEQLSLNQYRVTDLIKQGPQAGDFLATDPLDRALRVQIVAPAVAQDPAQLKKFRHAVQRAMGVHHAGVAHILDLGTTRGTAYLVSEYVEGETLEELLARRGKLNYEVAARIFAVAFDAVQALHAVRMSAAELRADSLVFASVEKSAGGGRTVRLVNAFFPRTLFDSSALGVIPRDQLAKIARPAAAPNTQTRLDEPARPEQDILRLGLLFYRCLTGQDAYPGGEPRTGSSPPSIKHAAPGVPDMLTDLVDSMVHPVAANRPKSAAGAATSLRVFLRAEEQNREASAEDKIVVPVHSPRLGARAAEAEESEGDLSVTPTDAEPAAEEAVAAESAGEPEINRLFRAVVKHEGSDLHLVVGRAPMMRLRNQIRPMGMPPLTEPDMERLTAPILNERSRKVLEETGGADFAHVIGRGLARFRVNLFRQRGQLSLVARRVNAKVPTFEKLHLPPVIEKLCHYDQGMVIVAGVTGSGKSTTLAAMLDYINEREHVHILTIEDPIEYLFTPKKAAINQREVGIDVLDWTTALKHVVRQDPDVILVGEMRDRDTFEAGLHAAETGHLVFCTIHASTAPSTIGRILDLFPADLHQAMRQSLAFNLKAVVCQKLLPSANPAIQRVPANEIMILNPTIRELIIKGDDKKLSDAIRIGMAEGMMDFNESLHQLVARGDVEPAAALEVSPNPDALKMILQGIRVAAPGIL